MTMHIGFVKLRMAITTYNDISSQVTEAKMVVHIEDFQIWVRQLLLMTIFPVI